MEAKVARRSLRLASDDKSDNPSRAPSKRKVQNDVGGENVKRVKLASQGPDAKETDRLIVLLPTMRNEDLIAILTTVLKDSTTSPVQVLAAHQGTSLHSRIKNVEEKIITALKLVLEWDEDQEIKNCMLAVEPFFELAASQQGEIAFRIADFVATTILDQINCENYGAEDPYCAEWFRKADKAREAGLCSWMEDTPVELEELKELQRHVELEAEQLADDFELDNCYSLTIDSLLSLINAEA